LTPTDFRQRRPECGRVCRHRWRPRYSCRWIGPHLLNRPREIPENSATRGSRPRGIPSVAWRRRRRARAHQRVRHPVWPSLRPHEPTRGRKLIVHWSFLPVASVDCQKPTCEFGRRRRPANMRGPRSCRAPWRAGPAARYGAANFRRLLRPNWLPTGQGRRSSGPNRPPVSPSACSELANSREMLE
jgi:hypothetical protein